jgi:WD40 repeat protein
MSSKGTGGAIPPTGPKQVTLFVSSPADVSAEREAVGRVSDRLHSAFHSSIRIRTVRWEHEYYTADRTFQKQIEDPQTCDIVVCIIWSRLGSELPPDFEVMPDGRPYPSGTVYELLKALDGKRSKGIPDVLVYRKTQNVGTPVNDPVERRRIQDQLDAVHTFWTEKFLTDEGHFLAGYHTFQSTDEFETQLGTHLRKWLTDKGLLNKSVVWPVAEKGSPFRGLEAFNQKHEEVFFGRSEDIDQAIRLIQNGTARGWPFLLITGKSGAGKSSLAAAGIIPRIIRLSGAEGSDVWRMAQIRPGGTDPLDALTSALFSALPELEQSDYPTTDLLRALLAHADKTVTLPITRTLGRLAEDWKKKQGLDRPATARIILLIDQLEELFSSEIDDRKRELFASVCAALLSSSSVILIATLRADAYPVFTASDTFRKMKAAGETLDVSTPQHAEIAEIVIRSTEAAGLTYGSNPDTGKKLSQVLTDAAGGQDALPLLQFALQKLYEKMVERIVSNGRTLGAANQEDLVLRFEDYTAFGGMEGALRAAADKAFENLDAEAQSRLPRLARALLRHGDTGFVLQSATVNQFGEDPASLRLVKSLTDARILVQGDDQSGVRFAHESVQRAWSRLAEVVTAQEAFYRVRAEVLAAHGRWLNARTRRAKATDYLISAGVPIAEAEQAASDFQDDFTPEQHDYIARSGRRTRIRQTVLKTAVAAFAGLFVVAGIFAVLAQRRGTAALLAESKILSVIVNDTTAPDREVNTPDPMFMSGDPTSAALIALEGLPSPGFAGNRPASPALQEALYDALLRIRETTLLDHTDAVNVVAFSPDGRYLVTGSVDKTARLWHRDGAKWTSVVLGEHSGPINAAAFSPNGQYLVTGSDDHTARIWNVANTPVTSVELRGHEAAVTRVAFSPDGRFLVTASDDNTARLWRMEGSQPTSVALRGHTDAIDAVAFSSDNRYLVTASWDHTARLWDLTKDSVDSVVLQGHTDRVVSAMFSPKSPRIVTTSNDGTARLWQIGDGAPTSIVLDVHKSPVNAAAFSPDDTRIATVSDDHTVKIWNIAASPPTEIVLRGHSDAVNFVAFSPDGKSIATGANDRTLRLWDLNGRQIVLEGHTAPITSIAFSPDGQYLVSASVDRTARIWDLVGGRRSTVVLRDHQGAVNFVAYSPDGALLASASDDGTARVWTTADLTLPPTVLRGHAGSVNAVAFSPDGKQIAAAYSDQTIRLWDSRDTAKIPTILRGHRGAVNAVAYSPDGAVVATASDDHTARLWDARNPETPPKVLEGHAGPVSSVAFSPDGKWLATGSWDQTIRLWNLAASSPAATELGGHTGAVNSVAFSPDGHWLVSTSHDQTARLWNLRVGEPTSVVLRGDTDSVNDAVFSPDGRHLITVSSDHDARLWDLTGNEPASFILEGHSRPITSIAFSPDGRHFATGSWDTTIRVWTHYPRVDDLIAAILEQSQRCLTSAQLVRLGVTNSESPTDKTRVPRLVVGHDGRPTCQ